MTDTDLVPPVHHYKTEVESDGRHMVQYAPWPTELDDLVEHLVLFPGWRPMLYDKVRDDPETHGGAAAGGLTFAIVVDGDDAYHPGVRRPVAHLFIVPAATYDRESWERWLFDRVGDVLIHEAGEHFVERRPCHRCVDGKRQTRIGATMSYDTKCEWCDGTAQIDRRPFAPRHGPGSDPYTVVQYATDEQRRTSFRGEVKTA